MWGLSGLITQLSLAGRHEIESNAHLSDLHLLSFNFTSFFINLHVTHSMQHSSPKTAHHLHCSPLQDVYTAPFSRNPSSEAADSLCELLVTLTPTHASQPPHSSQPPPSAFTNLTFKRKTWTKIEEGFGSRHLYDTAPFSL